MEPVKLAVAANLAELRKGKGLTQQQLADKFSYSDKSVSKWEHGETLPDIDTLKKLCDFYGVSLDFLVSEGSVAEKLKAYAKEEDPVVKNNKAIIIALACLAVWMVSVVVFVCLSLTENLLSMDLGHFWTCFIWAVPVTCLVLISFQVKWGKRKWNSWLIVAFIWTLLAAIFIQIGVSLPEKSGWTFWLLFFVGIPCTIATFLYGELRKRTLRYK